MKRERTTKQPVEPAVPDNIVPHPRYGSRPVPSASPPGKADLLKSYWGYRDCRVFPDTAIPADTSRQRYGYYPRPFYVDILKECRDCRRPFIFFALEQKHWYEELGFFIDAGCVRCPDCRASLNRVRFRLKRYSGAVSRDDLTEKELATLLDDIVFLYAAGLIRDLQKLRTLRNVARRRIRSHPATTALSRLIEQIASQSSP